MINSLPFSGLPANSNEQPPERNDAAYTTGTQGVQPSARTSVVKAVSLPPIALPSATMLDSNRTQLCQQLVGAVLTAAHALYAAQPSSRLAALAQQLLALPDSDLISFLERKYVVLRMAMEVQPNTSMAALADQLLSDLCGQQ
jgi:hypothetical protein